MMSFLGKVVRNMPNIPYKREMINPLRRIKSKMPLVVEDYQGTMKISVDINFAMQSQLFWFGYHHLEENRFLSRILRPHHVFLDIGANFGEFTILAAKYITEGKIFSFEPGRESFSQLKRNCDLNTLQNVHLFECALGNNEKQAELYCPDLKKSFHEGLSSLMPLSNEPGSSCSISVRRLDDIQEIKAQDRIDVVKIDVEGAELMVLQGGINTLTKYAPVIVIEINEVRFNKFGYSITDLIAVIHKIKDYKFFTFHLDGGLIPISIEDLTDRAVNKKDDSFNIACL